MIERSDLMPLHRDIDRLFEESRLLREKVATTWEQAAGRFGSCELISPEIVLTEVTASITFSSLPQGYRSLKLRYLVRTNRAEEYDTLAWRANGDTGNNYMYQCGYDLLASWNGVGSATSNTARCGRCEGANSRANVFGIGEVFWHRYSQSGIEKVSQAFGGSFGAADDLNASYIWLDRGLWKSITAIALLTILPVVGSFIPGCRFALYGIR